jgi:hypothetical protein
MQLTTYQAVPSGMSFDLDVTSTGTAYLLSTPGNEATVALQGTGVWAVEILASADGVEFTRLAVQTMPGQWRYGTKGAAAAAIRVLGYTSGVISGMLAHGGLTPITNVSALFGSYLVYNYNSTRAEPPSDGQLRFDTNLPAAVTKVWIAYQSDGGSDQYQSLLRLPVGGTLLVQKRNDHYTALLLTLRGASVDKGTYVEVPVSYQEHVGSLTAAQNQAMLVAVFSPGAAISLTPTTATALPGPPEPSGPIATPKARAHKP